MPKVSEAHRESRRDQILDAAMACFAEQGFQATTMADIIAASGLSAGSIYGYFESKQELAVAVAQRTIGGRVGEVATAAADRALSPSAVLRVISEGFDRERIDAGLILQLWGQAASDPDFRRVAVTAFAEFEGVFRRVLAGWAIAGRGATPTEAEEWAAVRLPLLLAAGQGLIVQRALMPAFDRERYLRAVAAALD